MKQKTLLIGNKEVRSNSTVLSPSCRTRYFIISALLIAYAVAASYGRGAQAASKTLPIRLGKPVKTTASTTQESVTTVQILNPSPGRLVYASARGKMTYLVLHDFSAKVSNGTDADKPATTIYPIERSAKASSGVVFGPLLSPNGRYILFKFGDPWNSFGKYQLYVIDTQTNTLKLASDKSLSYNLVSWSPDGNYITFIENGDRRGGTTQLDYYVGPLKLYICNWKTGKDYLVASNDTLSGPFNWIAPHTLVYGALSAEGQKIFDKQKIRTDQEKIVTSKVKPADKPVAVPRPNIYAYSVEKDQSRLLIKDGYWPNPSPDGQMIAFYGSETPDKQLPLSDGWQREAQGAALSVARIDGTERIALTREQGAYPFLLWLPDGRRLLTQQQIKDSPNAQAEIKEWNIQERRFRIVATLNAKDFRKISSSSVSPSFHSPSISQDGTKLFAFILEAIGQNDQSSFLDVLKSLQSVDLMTGIGTVVAQTKNDSGVDWHSEFPPEVTRKSNKP
jgi:Tol biopolymer transport system component